LIIKHNFLQPSESDTEKSMGFLVDKISVGLRFTLSKHNVYVAVMIRPRIRKIILCCTWLTWLRC